MDNYLWKREQWSNFNIWIKVDIYLCNVFKNYHSVNTKLIIVIRRFCEQKIIIYELSNVSVNTDIRKVFVISWITIFWKVFTLVNNLHTQVCNKDFRMLKCVGTMTSFVVIYLLWEQGESLTGKLSQCSFLMGLWKWEVSVETFWHLLIKHKISQLCKLRLIFHWFILANISFC